MDEILKFILTSFINYNLFFNVNGKVECCKCYKNRKNIEYNNVDENDNNNENGNKNETNNKKINDFSNIRETLLADLQNIIEINKYLKNGLKDENLLKNEIEGIDSPDKANILNTKLNKLKVETLNNLKKQYQETLQSINNNLSLLKNSGNFNIDKIVIDVKNDDIEKLKFENINDIKSINDKILNISKKYEDFITEIINSLKSKYDNLKYNDTDNILDVKDEEFDNLENKENKIEKIISINNKLKTAEQVINNDLEGIKNDIIKLFSELNPIKEKISKIVKNANSIFNLSINIKDKLNDNINDLKIIKTNLEELKSEFFSILNKKKTEIDKRCKIINDVKNNIKTEFNKNFEDLKVDKYDENNFEDIDKKVEDIEKDIIKFINNKVKELNKKEEDLKLKFKKLRLIYKDIKITKKSNSINDCCDYLIKYNKELDYRNCKIEFYVNINEPEKNNYDFSEIIKKFKKLEYSYEEKCNNFPNISFTISKDNYFEKFIDEFKTYEKGITYYLNKFGKISNYMTDFPVEISLKEYDIYFIYNDNFKKTTDKDIAVDAGGLRKTIFNNIKNDILNNKTPFNEKSFIKSLFNNKTELAPLNTVPKNNNNCTSTYYEFNNENNENTEICYKILGYICAASLRSNKNACGINLKLNPLIYKIILNYKDVNKDIKESLDQKKEKIKNILTYDDFKYYDSTYFIYFYKLQTDTLGEYKMLFEKDYIDGIRDKYNEMIENFANQIDNIKVFVKNFLEYLNYDIFKECGKDYIKLKLLIEGEDKITYEDLISKIIKFENIDNKNLCLSAYSKKNLKFIYELIIEVLKDFSEKDLKQFVMFVTGSDSLPIDESSITLAFSASDKYCYGFNAHTCFNKLDINPNKLVKGIFSGNLKSDKINDILKENLKKQIEKYLKESIYSVDTTALDSW